MATTRPDLDPYLNDPTRWAHSMAHHAELMLPCLDAVGARSVAEVGAFAGDLTRLLAEWASGNGARIRAIDPAPKDALAALAEERPEVELVRETSLEALPRIELPDVVVIDGDHNWHTVSEELRVIDERSRETGLPLVILHDVCWPHGRRDDYFDAGQIPAERRHEVAGEGRGIFPGDPGTRPGGLPYPRSAAREGGPRNGVLTAAVDFAGGRDELRLVVVPAFFGFGAVWHRDAPWAADVAAILDPWDRNPVLERLEANRVHHLATSHARQGEIWALEERLVRRDRVLRRLLESSAFGLAERLSRLRKRAGIAPAQSAVSREEIRSVLED